MALSVAPNLQTKYPDGVPAEWEDATGRYLGLQLPDGTKVVDTCYEDYTATPADPVIDGPSVEDRLAALESLQPDQDALAAAQTNAANVRAGGAVMVPTPVEPTPVADDDPAPLTPDAESGSSTGDAP